MHLPLYFDGQLTRCLVIGGGPSVLRKVELFLEAGSAVTVIAPQADFKIVVLASLSRVKWEQREFVIEDIENFDVVVIGREDVNDVANLVTSIRERKIPVNVCGDPSLSTFFVPAVLREGDMTIAVSSGGQAPFMAVEFLRRLGSAVKGWGNWLKLAARFRQAVIKNTKEVDRRKEYYDKFIQAGRVEIQPLPLEKTSIAEWLLILKHSQRAGSAPSTAQSPMMPKSNRATGFLPRSTYAAGYQAAETDKIPPPDEVGVATRDAPDWDMKYAAEYISRYQADPKPKQDE